MSDDRLYRLIVGAGAFWLAILLSWIELELWQAGADALRLIALPVLVPALLYLGTLAGRAIRSV